MLGVNYCVVLLRSINQNKNLTKENYKFSKLFIDLKVVWSLLTLQEFEKSLKISGFFGEVIVDIPSNVVLEVNSELKGIYLFFIKDHFIEVKYIIKSFYLNLIFSLYGIIFNHFVDIIIKGIGYRFEKDSLNHLLIFHGNVNPSIFKIPKNIKLLTNANTNIFSICGSNYTLINNFIGQLRSICKPGRYKEVGLFVQKRL